MFYIHINYHKSLTNFQNFFYFFVSALALFLVSLMPRIFQAFLFFFQSGAFFYFLFFQPRKARKFTKDSNHVFSNLLTNVKNGRANQLEGVSNISREPNGAPLPTRGEGLGWGIIFLKNKKLHTPPLPLPFKGGELLAHKFFLFDTPCN